MSVAYRRYHHVDVKIVRIFNTYGTRMRIKDGRAIPAFISQALTERTDDGLRQRRSDAKLLLRPGPRPTDLCRLLFSEHPGPVNIGNPAEMTILQLAETIRDMTGSKSTIDYKPLPEDDPKVRQPDITLARNLLDWSPEVSLEDGLGKTIEYFRSKLQ